METPRRQAIHDVMVRLADGDRSAFPTLLDELWPVILAFAQRGLGQAQDAEDVAQEVFLRICARISDFDRARDGLSWAYGIASYEILTVRRRRQRRREAGASTIMPQVDGHPDHSASQEEVVVTEQLVAMLNVAAGTLRDEDRLALGLDSAPGATPASAASPAERKRRQRALDRLRSVWRRLYGEP